MLGLVQVIEAHIAFVFLTDVFAFKLKKPVNFGYFDHRNLDTRAVVCTEEVRLNRALAGDVYIGTVPLVLTKTGISFGGDGSVIGWIVHMRRLPADRMLDALVTAEPASPSETEFAPVVTHLVRFYLQQQTLRPPTGLYLAHLEQEQAVILGNLLQMARFLSGVPLAAVTTVLQDRITGMASEIATCETTRSVIEGYGDLRPEHVCMTVPP